MALPSASERMLYVVAADTLPVEYDELCIDGRASTATSAAANEFASIARRFVGACDQTTKARE